MPPLPNQIGISRFDAWLARTFRLRERSVTPTLATELIPVTGFELDRPESYLNGETLLVAGATLVQPAAQTAASGLGNPGGSGSLLVVESLSVTSSVAAAFDLRQMIAIAGTVTAGQPRDLRGFGTIPAGQTCVDVAGAIAPLGTVHLRRFELTPGGQIAFPHLNIVLPPLFGVALFSSTAITGNVRCSWSWYERPYEPSEEHQF